ncbi:MAG TPA: GNAT family N-acetyltransferase [Clostridia bacterium]|jgi:hypothetical protein|nr:GNAT family N-acetyltransferase [Clostridia bacterium]
MLKLTPTNDKTLLDRLSNEIFGHDFGHEVGFVFQKGEENIGIARITCTPEKSTVVKVGIIPSERGQGYGDFFTRCLLLKMSDVSERIEIEYISDYYKKFGFTEENGKMIIDSGKLYFPRACQKGE